MADDEDWIMRPVLEGVIQYESLVNGSLDLFDVLRLNEALDVRDENTYRVGQGVKMANDAEVLRQFLVSLGFQINEVSQRKFDTTVMKTDATIKTLGKTIMATATAAQAMVVGFANSFERLYYMSQKITEAGTPTSVGDIKAASAAGRQIGLNAETIQRTVENMARAIRDNPAVEQIIATMTGKPVKGRKMTQVMEMW